MLILMPVITASLGVQLFGEGRHPNIERLFETRLAPFLSQKGYNFWSTRLWYFKEGLYYQGGMVRPGTRSSCRHLGCRHHYAAVLACLVSVAHAV